MKGISRYRAVVSKVLLERGEVCEACKEPATHVHHVIPCSETGMASELVFDPANLIVLCDDCHALMHPGYRSYDWHSAEVSRGKALNKR